MAMCVQFNDGAALETYVWGYRWESGRPEGGPTTREIFHAIASEGWLDVLEQRNGLGKDSWTLAGLAFTPAQDALPDIYFDFAGALADGRLTFGYYATDSNGELIGPGDATPGLCASALAQAAATHIISHPLDAAAYGVPAYDYDHWHMRGISAARHWNAGWNTGNWVLWTGGTYSSDMTYCGMAYATRRFADNEVAVWNFNRHDSYPSGNDRIDGYTGASTPQRPLCYNLAAAGIRVTAVNAAVGESYYDITGRRLPAPPAHGLFIRCRGSYRRLIIK